MLLRLTLLIVVASLAACDSAGPLRATSDLDLLTPGVIDWRTLSQDPDALVGTWEWVSSTYEDGPLGGGEFGAVLTTPESTGRTETWIFGADGTATRVDAGDALFQTTYRVERRSYGNGTEDEYPSIQFGDGGYGLDFGVDGDVLILDATPVDGPQSRYRLR